MVIYDCDGVIFDSKKANFEYYSYIFEKFKLPSLDLSDLKITEVLHTYSNDNVFKYFIKDEQLLSKVIKFSKTVDYSIFYRFMQLEENFFETCKILKEKNILISVATNRSVSFKGIAEYFKLNRFLDDYVTALNVKNAKPAPDMLLLLLMRNNLNRDEVVFVGDSEIDLKAAKKAEIDFVGYKFSKKSILTIKNHSELLGCTVKVPFCKGEYRRIQDIN